MPLKQTVRAKFVCADLAGAGVLQRVSPACPAGEFGAGTLAFSKKGPPICQDLLVLADIRRCTYMEHGS